MILAVVYILNFTMTGKCTMSTYHYYVALDSILIACATMVITFITSHHEYWKTLAGVLRFLSTLIVFILVGIFLGYQMFTHWDTDFPEWNPPDFKKRNDSAIIIPVSCFFDPDLIARSNPYAPNRTTPLTDLELDRIGRPVKSRSLPQLWIYVLLALCFIVKCIMEIAYFFSSNRSRASQMSKRKGSDTRIVWGLALCVTLATDLFCIWHIGSLRSFTKKSGWLEDGSENEMYSIGQLMPILALFAVLFVLFERVKWGEETKMNQMDFQDVQHVSHHAHGKDQHGQVNTHHGYNYHGV